MSAYWHALTSMLKTWNIKQKFHTIVNDSGANIVKATSEIAKLSYIRCTIHTLQLVVNAAMMSQQAVIDSTAIARKIVGHFQHSTLACETLNDLQKSLGLPQKKLKQDGIPLSTYCRVFWNNAKHCSYIWPTMTRYQDLLRISGTC